MALVGYQSGTGIRYCYVPLDKILAGQALVEELEAGLDAMDVTKIMPVVTLDPSDFQKEARRRGLWTAEDYRRNPQKIRSILQRLLGWHVHAILAAAERAAKGG